MIISASELFADSDSCIHSEACDPVYAVYTEAAEEMHYLISTQTNVLIYILDGRNSLDASRQPVDTSVERACFVKRGSELEGRILTGASGMHKSIALFYDDQMLFDLLNKYGEVRTRTVERDLPEWYVCFDVDQRLRESMQSLLPYLKDRSGTMIDQLVRVKLEEIFLLLLDSSSGQALLSLLYGVRDVKESCFRSLIEQMPDDVDSVDKLIRHSKMAPNAFRKYMKQYFDATPKQWLDDRKLKKAADMLVNSHKNISEICLDSGFNNFSWFSQRFKQYYQHTPNEYRKLKTAYE